MFLSYLITHFLKQFKLKYLNFIHLKKNTGIIKLLTPSFEKGNINPGYIMSYLPGTRENGGQYTHGAVWAIIAEAMLNNAKNAVDYIKMINPIEHSMTNEKVNKYKIEP